jgi:hypothetical protein
MGRGYDSCRMMRTTRMKLQKRLSLCLGKSPKNATGAVDEVVDAADEAVVLLNGAVAEDTGDAGAKLFAAGGTIDSDDGALPVEAVDSADEAVGNSDGDAEDDDAHNGPVVVTAKEELPPDDEAIGAVETAVGDADGVPYRDISGSERTPGVVW